MRAPYRMSFDRFLLLAAVFPALLVSPAMAQTAASDKSPGWVEFDHPGGGSPTVELDLSAGMLRDMIGLGDAVIAGVVQGINQATADKSDLPEEVKLATQQMEAIRGVINKVENLIQGVRVQVYKDSSNSTALASHYTEKLSTGGWERIVKVQEEGKEVCVFTNRSEGALTGLFVSAGEGSQQVLVNVVCQLSPEQVQEVATLLTKTGIQMGGEKAINDIVEGIRKQQGKL